jgi:hypothetical protein
MAGPRLGARKLASWLAIVPRGGIKAVPNHMETPPISIVAGLVPATATVKAPRRIIRVARVKPGHDSVGKSFDREQL